ncbi:hypothetical protein EAO72_39385 [Streptomyces sp. or43]|nr:hypothetical protein EAO72_39385 [Streptomyces sp. or43]
MLGGKAIADGAISLGDLETMRELLLSMPPASREGMLDDDGLPTVQAIETSGNRMMFSLGAQALSKHWSESAPSAHRGSGTGEQRAAAPGAPDSP